MISNLALPGSVSRYPDQAAQWQHLQQLTRTLHARELLSDPFETLLFHLFHQEQVSVLPAEAVRFGCRCSMERAGNTLKAIGEQEAQGVLQEQGSITIHCEFCQQEYRFDAAAVERLFPGAGDATVH